MEPAEPGKVENRSATDLLTGDHCCTFLAGQVICSNGNTKTSSPFSIRPSTAGATVERLLTNLA